MAVSNTRGLKRATAPRHLHLQHEQHGRQQHEQHGRQQHEQHGRQQQSHLQPQPHPHPHPHDILVEDSRLVFVCKVCFFSLVDVVMVSRCQDQLSFIGDHMVYQVQIFHIKCYSFYGSVGSHSNFFR